MQPNWLLITIALCVLVGQRTCDGRSKKYKLCKFDNFFNCYFEGTNFLTLQANGTGLPSNEAELQQLCFSYHDFYPLCVRTWTNQCATPIMAALVEQWVVQPVAALTEQICSGSKKENMRTLVRHAPCINSKVKLVPEYRERCIKPFLLNSEFAHNQGVELGQHFGQVLRNTCCATRYWFSCIQDMIKEECGQEASDSFPYMLHYSNHLNICPPQFHDPKNAKQCPPEQFKAPPDYQGGVPKGLKSTSLASHFFSASCPHVAYGFDD